MTLKTKLILGINLAAILALLIFAAASAGKIDQCKSDLYLLWTNSPSEICGGGQYNLYICLDENDEAQFVSTCTSGISTKEEGLFFPVILNSGVILGTPPILP